LVTATFSQFESYPIRSGGHGDDGTLHLVIGAPSADLPLLDELTRLFSDRFS